MIRLTRLNNVPLVVNSDLIEHIEVTPDTVVTLTSGQTFLVLESADEVIERVVAFRHKIARAQSLPEQFDSRLNSNLLGDRTRKQPLYAEESTNG